MPLYEYAALAGGCRKCRRGFEVVQKLAEPRLTKCPACGKPVERVLGAVRVHTKYALSKSRLNDAGMTQYRKTSDGSYERTAGHKGPKLIRKPDED
jgi:putative FmdB family regulatory protein